jgi:hypothetical protein
MNVRMRKTSVLLAIGACAVSLFRVADASANIWRHFPPNMCTAVNGYAAPALNSAGQEYNPSPGSSSLWSCPVVTDSNFPGSSTAAYAQLWGYQPYSSAVGAAECRTYYGGGGGNCGPTNWSGGGTGTYALQWVSGSSDGWSGANPADSLYLSVNMGAPSSGSYTVLFGYGFSE